MRSVRSGRSRTTGRSGSPPWTSARPVSRAPARSTSSLLASIAAGSARCGSTPFSQRFEPSVRSAEPLGGPAGSRSARSSPPRAAPRSSSSATSLSAPPMIAASATGLLTVGDQEVALVERAQRAVERAELLARARAAHDDPPAVELGAVERVQRAAVHVHDVVRHVDDVRDRAHAGGVQACAQPDRRRPDGDVRGRRGRCSAGSPSRSSTSTSTGFGRAIGGSSTSTGMQLAVEERRDLPREPDHREQVDAVQRRRHVEHLVADRQHVGERRPRLDPVGEEHDPGMVGAEPDLVLGEDHPARDLAAQRALVERRREAGQEHAGEADGDGGADAEVPGAADDLARLALPHVDLAELELVGVRDAWRPRRPCRRGGTTRLSPASATPRSMIAVDLERRDAQAPRDLVGGGVDADVLAEPGERRAHQNWLEKRRSLRQSSRRSGNSWRSIAIRSSPQPNAKPV